MHQSGQALGLHLDAELELAPVIGQGEATSRAATLRSVPRAAVDAAWSEGGERLTSSAAPGARRPNFTVDRGPAHTRVWASGHGRYLVSADGTEALCALPPRGAIWRWQRLVVAQVLPLLAAAQGMYLLHASAVSDGRRAIAIVGASGSGKTSVGAQLVARGLRLLSDDVLALDPATAVAYPGTAVSRLHYDELERLPPGLGRVVARGEKAHVELPRDPAARPLTAVYAIEPRAEASAIAVEPAEGASSLLLGGVYPAYSLGTEHTLAQLAAAAEVSRTAAAFVVVTPRVVASPEVAAAILEHAGLEPCFA